MKEWKTLWKKYIQQEKENSWIQKETSTFTD
jgi:hypothetical protein